MYTYYIGGAHAHMCVMRLYGRTSERVGDGPVTVDGFIIDSQTLYIF